MDTPGWAGMTSFWREQQRMATGSTALVQNRLLSPELATLVSVFVELKERLEYTEASMVEYFEARILYVTKVKKKDEL